MESRLKGSYKVVGPPGCGKTTFVTRQVHRILGYQGSVSICSFTKAAAIEMEARDLPIPRDSIGTLHAHCFRALGSTRIAEIHGIKEWNESNRILAMTVKADDGDPDIEMDQGRNEGDKLKSEYQVLRSRMIDRKLWPMRVRSFANKWENWKRESDLIDFTDMIEIAASDLDTAPGNPTVVLVDEAQDLSKLEMTVIQKWSDAAEASVIVGDPYQNLFSFKGSDSNIFLGNREKGHFKVLSESFRIPIAVHARAMKWISQHSNYEHFEYRPRDEEGEVRPLGCSFKDPYMLLKDAQKYLDQGKTVMFLGSCGYMVNDLKEELRAAGMPFHNPFRRKRGDWNPLHSTSGVSTADRMLAYLRPNGQVWKDKRRLWTRSDLSTWIKLIKAKGAIKYGAKKRAMELKGSEVLSIQQLLEIFNEDALSELLRIVETSPGGAVKWLKKHAMKQKIPYIEYPAHVIRKHGPSAIYEAPKIIIGTVHSVKGGEADVVYLFPDLSPQGIESWNTRSKRDTVIRMFYVGMTRARESLILCEPRSSMSVTL